MPAFQKKKKKQKQREPKCYSLWPGMQREAPGAWVRELNRGETLLDCGEREKSASVIKAGLRCQASSLQGQVTG